MTKETETEYQKVYQQEYLKTKTAVINRIYAHQRADSKRVKEAYPNYSKAELIEFLSTTNFDKLFARWEKAYFFKKYKPTIQKIDVTKGYTIKNLKVTTNAEILAHNGKLKQNGIINGKQLKAVEQYTKEGEYIREFFSISEAERETKVKKQNILSCCAHRLKSAGGYSWEYK